MEKNQNKKFIVSLAIGAGLEFLVVFLTGLFGMTPVLGGLLAAIDGYFAVWGQATVLAFICVGLYLFDIVLFLVNVVLSVIKKKFLLILQALCLLLAIAFLPFLFLMIFPQLEAGNVSVGGLYILALLLLLNILSIVLLAHPLKSLYRCKACQHAQENRASGLNEKEVRQIVEQYLKEHEEEAHKAEEKPVKEEPKQEPVKEEPVIEEKAEEPVEEQPVEEEVEEEEEAEVAQANPFSRDEIIQEGEVVNEEEYEIVEVLDENGQKVKVKRRRKASFETRLKGSEFDLRHKYYDLRDYIKWYGLNNRISLPGDTFSYKRKKIAFITIIGKRIKFYIALDPAKYEDSPIPVERVTAKKYADTPCLMKIRSDLSYRRAKKLVDEAMKEAGIPKPEGEEPKETQHPEKD